MKFAACMAFSFIIFFHIPLVKFFNIVYIYIYIYIYICIYMIGNVDQLLALLYAFKIFIYIEYSKTYNFVQNLL